MINVKTHISCSIMLLFVGFLFTSGFHRLDAQCFASFQFPFEDISAPCFLNQTDTISTMSESGQFIVLKDLEIGKSYTIKSSLDTDYLTLREIGSLSGDPILAASITPLSFVATCPSIQVHLHTDSECGRDKLNRTTSISCDDCESAPSKVGVHTSTPQAILEVNGEIKVGSLRSKPTAGMIRFNESTSDFEGYTGERWVSLTKPNASWGEQQTKTFVESQKVTSDDGAFADRFGTSVAIDGNLAVVGARSESGLTSSEGAAYIFQKMNGRWNQIQKLKADIPQQNANFGRSVSINGQYIAVGSSEEDIGMNADQGAVYIFKKSGNSWLQEAKLTASDGGVGDFFGSSVSITNAHIIIGSYRHHSTFFIQDDGAAYIFDRNGSNWTEAQKLTHPFPSTDNYFGISVSMDGNYAIIGCRNDDQGQVDQGSAFIYIKTNGSWALQKELRAFDGFTDQGFGRSVAISGSYVIVGTTRVDHLGAAYVYARDGIDWIREAKLIPDNPSEYSYFGLNVDISGDRAIVGTLFDNTNTVSRSGSAQLYYRESGEWIFEAKLLSSDMRKDDIFGTYVTISGSTCAVSTPHTEENGNNSQGSVYFFEKN